MKGTFEAEPKPQPAVHHAGEDERAAEPEVQVSPDGAAWEASGRGGMGRRIGGVGAAAVEEDGVVDVAEQGVEQGETEDGEAEEDVRVGPDGDDGLEVPGEADAEGEGDAIGWSEGGLVNEEGGMLGCRRCLVGGGGVNGEGRTGLT